MEQGTPEWYEARKGRITASAAGAILGNSPWQTRDDVLRRMVREYHGATSEPIEGPQLAYGTAMEPFAREHYEEITGHTVDQSGFIAREPFFGCSPDGLIGNEGGVEIKCPYGLRDPNKGRFKALAEQPQYYDQVQLSLWVTGRAWWDFYQWRPIGADLDESYRLERVTLSDKWVETSIPALFEFWGEYLKECQRPYYQKHLEPKRAEIDTPRAAQLIAEYDELSEAMDRAKTRRDEILDEIVKLANGNNARIFGRNLTLVKRPGSVAYAKALKDLMPDADLEAYRGTASECWKLG